MSQAEQDQRQRVAIAEELVALIDQADTIQRQLFDQTGRIDTDIVPRQLLHAYTGAMLCAGSLIKHIECVIDELANDEDGD